MNKKVFIGATALTAVTVAGVVYYRHVITEQIDRFLNTWNQGHVFLDNGQFDDNESDEELLDDLKEARANR